MKILLFKNKQLSFHFLQILLSAFGIGLARLLLPFRIIELGGGESLVSFSSVLYAIGQIVGILMLGKLSGKRKASFFVVMLMWFMTMAIMIFPFLFTVVIARFFEGLGYGLLVIAILNYAESIFQENKGEVVGTLFGSIFLGGAIGQGLAGFFEEQLFGSIINWIFSPFQIVLFIGLCLTLLSLLISIFQLKTSKEKKLFDIDRVSLPHFHFKNLKSLFKYTPFLFLLIIYALYDFAHGIYTPNLPLVLSNHNISKIHISLIFFTGDAVWGVSQIFTGKLVDKLGSWIPMALSMVIKGLGVAGYNLIYVWGGVLCLFIIVGIGESLMEPARNIAILDIENYFDSKLSKSKVMHKHKHLNVSISRGQGFTFGIHSHLHEHKPSKESMIMGLQLAGIFSFGLGGVVGSTMLKMGSTAEFLIYIGAAVLVISSVIGIFGNIINNRKIKTSVE
ncbi:MAG: MFS transporter [Candidatus Heimdallarchaeaceae archaeon]